jgi:cytochrome P450
VDLVQAYAHPIPAMMICELLGGPYEDRETFTRHAAMPSARVPTGGYAHCATRTPSTSSRRRPVAIWAVAGQSALNAGGA